MQDGWKVVWSIPYVSVAFFLSWKHNFTAYRSSKVSSRPDCIFEIHQLWQSGFSRVYSNCCCRCSFEVEIIKIGQSSHKMYSNNIVNFQESMMILNAHMKKVWKLIVCTSYMHLTLKKKWCVYFSSLVIILFYNNTQLHMTRMTSQKFIDLGYETLPHPSYAPNLSTTNYNFFQTSGHIGN